MDDAHSGGHRSQLPNNSSNAVGKIINILVHFDSLKKETAFRESDLWERRYLCRVRLKHANLIRKSTTKTPGKRCFADWGRMKLATMGGCADYDDFGPWQVLRLPGLGLGRWSVGLFEPLFVAGGIVVRQGLRSLRVGLDASRGSGCLGWDFYCTAACPWLSLHRQIRDLRAASSWAG
jgi:hypothetical protein